MITAILLPMTILIIAVQNHILFSVLLPVYIVVSVILPFVAMKTGWHIGMTYRRQVGAIKDIVLRSVYGIQDVHVLGIGDERAGRVQEKKEKINRTAYKMTIHRQLVTSTSTFFVHLVRNSIVGMASCLSLSDGVHPVGTIILSSIILALFQRHSSLLQLFQTFFKPMPRGRAIIKSAVFL